VRRSSSICLQVTGLIESSIAQEPGAGRTAILGIVRRVGTRTQLENNEWVVTSDARVPPAEHHADEINARPRRFESAQVRSVPKADSAGEWNRPRINSFHDVLVVQTRAVRGHDLR